MSQYLITGEDTEDTYDATDNLDEAIRIANALVRNGHEGGPVFIERDGLNIWQFARLQNGDVEEKRLVA
ncbi:MAG TPA: hypothetical protein VHX65_20330 [Pirellulales bacterium]|nr:hypothetical protein [Pirellulales bacterium]